MPCSSRESINLNQNARLHCTYHMDDGSSEVLNFELNYQQRQGFEQTWLPSPPMILESANCGYFTISNVHLLLCSTSPPSCWPGIHVLDKGPEHGVLINGSGCRAHAPLQVKTASSWCFGGAMSLFIQIWQYPRLQTGMDAVVRLQFCWGLCSCDDDSRHRPLYCWFSPCDCGED